MSKTEPSRVLIARQSTIPHHRVGYHDSLEGHRPGDWTLDGIYDERESPGIIGA